MCVCLLCFIIIILFFFHFFLPSILFFCLLDSKANAMADPGSGEVSGYFTLCHCNLLCCVNQRVTVFLSSLSLSRWLAYLYFFWSLDEFLLLRQNRTLGSGRFASVCRWRRRPMVNIFIVSRIQLKADKSGTNENWTKLRTYEIHVCCCCCGCPHLSLRLSCSRSPSRQSDSG